MVWWELLPEVLRELRWWSAPTTCPWGAVVLVILVASSSCCLLGFCLGALTFNPFCRRLVVNCARALLVGADGDRALQVSVRSRLAEYHRGGWCKPPRFLPTGSNLSLFNYTIWKSQYLLGCLIDLQVPLQWLWVPVLSRGHRLDLEAWDWSRTCSTLTTSLWTLKSRQLQPTLYTNFVNCHCHFWVIWSYGCVGPTPCGLLPLGLPEPFVRAWLLVEGSTERFSVIPLQDFPIGTATTSSSEGGATPRGFGRATTRPTSRTLRTQSPVVSSILIPFPKHCRLTLSAAHTCAVLGKHGHESNEDALKRERSGVGCQLCQFQKLSNCGAAPRQFGRRRWGSWFHPGAYGVFSSWRIFDHSSLERVGPRCSGRSSARRELRRPSYARVRGGCGDGSRQTFGSNTGLPGRHSHCFDQQVLFFSYSQGSRALRRQHHSVHDKRGHGTSCEKFSDHRSRCMDCRQHGSRHRTGLFNWRRGTRVGSCSARWNASRCCGFASEDSRVRSNDPATTFCSGKSCTRGGTNGSPIKSPCSISSTSRSRPLNSRVGSFATVGRSSASSSCFSRTKKGKSVTCSHGTGKPFCSSGSGSRRGTAGGFDIVGRPSGRSSSTNDAGSATTEPGPLAAANQPEVSRSRLRSFGWWKRRKLELQFGGQRHAGQGCVHQGHSGFDQGCSSWATECSSRAGLRRFPPGLFFDETLCGEKDSSGRKSTISISGLHASRSMGSGLLRTWNFRGRCARCWFSSNKHVWMPERWTWPGSWQANKIHRFISWWATGRSQGYSLSRGWQVHPGFQRIWHTSKTWMCWRARC